MPDALQPQSPPPSVFALPSGAKIADASASLLLDKVKDAQSLLGYAVDAGISIDDEIRRDILHAANDIGAYSSPEAGAKLLAGMTELAKIVAPVTAESLAACNNARAVNGTVTAYRSLAVLLALIIVPISLITFATTSISEATLKDITEANALAVKLTDLESSPKTEGKADRLPREASVIRDLQTLAGSARAVDARARQLNWFVMHIVDDPFGDARKNADRMRANFELDPGLPNLSDALKQRISTFQLVRQFAQSAREAISTVYGAIAAGILPVLYALLGAVAYLLRSYQQQLKDRTFTPFDSHIARFVTAAIGGGVVGLFTNFTSGGAAGVSISPLAVAFLVGYATDVFFSFLDSFVHTFNRSSAPAASYKKKP